MRLLTHNVLRNSAKGVIQGFPFNLEATKVEVKETDFDPQFIKNLLSTLNLEGLRVAVSDLGLDVSALPTALTPELQEDESFLKALHSMLMDIHVIEGKSILRVIMWPLEYIKHSIRSVHRWTLQVH